MRLFNTISVEISSLCNRKCWFCPNATNKRPDEQMSDELIWKIVRELAVLEYNGRVELYIYNEPMRDKRLEFIISLFRMHVPKCCIMIASNCDYIKESKQIQDLFDAGLNQFQANIYSDYDRFMEILDMFQHVKAEPGNVYLYVSPNKKVFSIERKYGIVKGSQVGRFELNNRSGNVPGLPKTVIPLQKLCVRPFRYMQVNWKGEAILCCNDYHGDVVVGDVNKDVLQIIWEESTVLKRYRKILLAKSRVGLELCEDCSFIGGAYKHLIATQWPELISQVKKKPDTRRLFGTNAKP